MPEVNNSPEVLEACKKRCINLLLKTNRKGIENLIDFLENKSDYFTAPASTKFHNDFTGGLMLHSLNVYDNFNKLLQLKPEISVKEDSVIIASLCHDLCKVNYYTIEQRNRKVNDKWEKYDVYTSIKNPKIPLPHASRSLRILRMFCIPTYQEELMIFYHMGPYGGEDFEYKNLLQEVNSSNPETLLFYMADLMSSYFDEEIRPQ